MIRRTLRVWYAVFMLAVIPLLPAAARGANFDYDAFNGELGLRFAYGRNLSKASVQLYSLLPRWGIFLARPGNSLLCGLGVSFVVEGIVSVAQAEETGFEVGVTPMLKFSLPLFPRTLLFLEGGAGLISENINSNAIAHTFNFTPQVGAGLDFAIRPHLAFTVAYRFRHSSNAGIYSDNPAFNVHLFQAGLTYYY
jgi:opacity protein-like surface antigen